MVEKASSSKMILLASLATSVPVRPMARPTSARLSAGASLVPSPVTATTSSCSWSNVTRRSLSSGCARGKHTQSILDAGTRFRSPGTHSSVGALIAGALLDDPFGGALGQQHRAISPADHGCHLLALRSEVHLGNDLEIEAQLAIFHA